MLGIVVGLAEEARLARGLGGVVSVGNGTTLGAQKAVDALIRGGATELLSFGVAGGLGPGLSAGTVLIPGSVLTAVGEIMCDVDLVHRLGGPSGGLILGHGVVAVSAAEKARLHYETGAVAIDLESGVVATTASANRLPFAVVRAVCDPASRTLPASALAALDEQGQIKPFAVLAAIARRPVEIVSLAMTALDALAARQGLARYVETVDIVRWAPTSRQSHSSAEP